MTQWYYANKNNERQGPVEAGVIRDKLSRGELNQDTLLWRDGMAQWQPVASVQAELAAADRPPFTPVEPPAATPAESSPISDSPASPYAAPSSTLSVGDGTVASAVDGGIVYAGFWKRVAANIIDGMLVNAVSFALMMIIAPIFGLSALSMFGIPEGGWANPEAAVGLTAFEVILQLVLMALTMTYFAWFHSSQYMASLGKMAVGIKVVRADGTPITLARGIGRYFAFMLSSFTMGIGLVMAAFTGRKQALHDVICDTLVVDKWAFTDRPDLQQRGVGTVTIVVLVLFGVLMLLVFVMLMVAIAAAIAQLS